MNTTTHPSLSTKSTSVLDDLVTVKYNADNYDDSTLSLSALLYRCL